MPVENTNDEFLVALVDRPAERAEVEYKGWVSLDTAETSAKLAKHLCALANYGGGWLVFGISDRGSHDEPHPSDLSNYDHDTINRIASTYLTPAFECDVVHVRSGVTAKLYPVIRVPPHGSVPICARRNGPQTGSKIEGVRQGVHYTRAPGPESVPVDSAELWRSIIHRCVVNERETLLSSIGRLFDRPIEAQTAEGVDRLLDEGIALWEASQLDSGWRADPYTNRCAFAFHMLDESNGTLPPIPLHQLERAVRDASFSAKNESGFGWPLFGISELSEQPKVDVFE
jgi:Putative DNA-binding domain